MGWVVSNHLNAGIEPKPIGNENFTASPSGTFGTATGPLNIAANEQKQFEALCRLIERPDLAADPRFAGRQARKDNRATLSHELNDALAARPAVEWEAMMNADGVPAGSVLGVPAILREAQVADRGFVDTLAVDGLHGEPLRVTRPGFRFAQDFPIPEPPPTLGRDTAAWLAGLGLDADEIAGTAARGVIGCRGPETSDAGHREGTNP